VRVPAIQKASRHHLPQNWHSGTEVLFSMSSLIPIHSSRKQIMIPGLLILKMDEQSTEGDHRRLASAGNLHQCTNAKNTAQELPLFATFRGARASATGATLRHKSILDKKFGTGTGAVWRYRELVARTR
jgi:hypothetical protein